MSLVGDSVGHINTTQTIFKWEIDNFCVNCKEPKQRLTSPCFVAQNLNWQLEFYPKGQANSKGHVSLCLKLRDTDKEMKIKCLISIINHKNEKFLTCGIKDRKFSSQHQSWGWLDFMKIDELVDKKNNLITNDKLVILCEMIKDETVYIATGITENKMKKENHFKRLESLQNFKKFFNNQKFSDVMLVVHDNVLYAHKNILANQSAVFAAMFEHDMKENIENQVSINDIDYDVFLELLRFLYTCKVNNMDKVAKRLIHAADMYELNQLKDLCAEHLADNLSVDNVVECLTLAERYSMKLLKNKAIHFISSNAESMISDDS